MAARSATTAPAWSAYRTDDELSVPYPEVVAAVLHMWVNRMIRDAPRAHELTFYDHVHRARRDAAARGGQL